MHILVGNEKMFQLTRVVTVSQRFASILHAKICVGEIA